jgi:phosphatidylinositol phospholipase C, delta
LPTNDLNCCFSYAFSQMVTEVFGNTLYYPDTEKHLKEFPSPESLKNRVILSTKPPKEYLEAKTFKERDAEHADLKKKNEEEAWGTEVPDFQTEIESLSEKVKNVYISRVYYLSCL